MQHERILLSVTAALALTVSPVQAASISYFLDLSNDLPDNVNYAKVTISDSTVSSGDIDFNVEVLTDAFSVSGGNFGMQSFAFNYDESLSVDASNIVAVSQPGWRVSSNRNAGGGFGKYDIFMSGKGNSRVDTLAFTVSGVTGDTVYSYALGSSLKPDADEFFAAHIAGYDYMLNTTSAKFAGSTAVPVPASILLFGSGLLAFMAATRRRGSGSGQARAE